MTIDPDIFLLTDRACLVTGAAAGLGQAIARAFARFGAQLALCDRDADGLAETVARAPGHGTSALTDVFDVREVDEIRRFMERVAERFGGLDVLVNNAGGGFPMSFDQLSDTAQSSLISENFVSAANMTRAALPLMSAGGSIVNITSIEAHRAAPNYSVYSAMKAALASLTRTLALELGDRNIRVNCIAPDVIPTPGIGGEEALGEPSTPLPRRGTPDDVAAAAVYLASEASGFVTGTTLHVDGGNAAAGGWHRQADGTFAT